MHSQMSEYFDGVPSMQRKLVKAIIRARKKRCWEPETLDQKCGFVDPDGIEVVKTSVFESDPSRMTSRIFSTASFVLNLAVDDVLKPKLNGDEEKIIQYMKKHREGVVAAVGKGTVKYEDQVRAYVILRALAEMDESVSSAQKAARQ
jgi:hypothetical protein